MTTEQILELAKEHLEEWEADEDGRTWVEFSGTAKNIIQFAQQIAEIEYNRGWKDREEVEYSNRLNVGNTPIVPDETMEELLKNGVKK